MKPRSPVVIAALLAIALFCAVMAWIYYAKFIAQGRPKTGFYPVEEFRPPQVEHPPDPREQEPEEHEQSPPKPRP